MSLCHPAILSSCFFPPPPAFQSGIPVAILLGMGLRNSVGLPAWAEPGVKRCTTTVLRAGIVCVGAKLSAVDVLASGAASIPAALLAVGTGLTVVPMVGRAMGLTPKLSYLIAGGTSICGVTAITALAPALNASAREQSVAIATVVAFGTTAMLSYPYLAHAVFEHSQQIGLFLGLAIHDTSQVIGSALTYSAVYSDEVVLKVAAVTKLTRNVCLAGVVPLLSVMNAKREHRELAAAAQQGSAAAPAELPVRVVLFVLLLSACCRRSHVPRVSPQPLSIRKYIPSFVYGFVGMSALRSVGDFTLKEHGAAFGVIDADTWTSGVSTLAGTVGGHYLLGTAMAGVGLSTAASALKGVGVKPFAVGFVGAMAVGSVGFAAASALPFLGLV